MWEKKVNQSGLKPAVGGDHQWRRKLWKSEREKERKGRDSPDSGGIRLRESGWKRDQKSRTLGLTCSWRLGSGSEARNERNHRCTNIRQELMKWFDREGNSRLYIRDQDSQEYLESSVDLMGRLDRDTIHSLVKGRVGTFQIQCSNFSLREDESSKTLVEGSCRESLEDNFLHKRCWWRWWVFGQRSHFFYSYDWKSKLLFSSFFRSCERWQVDLGAQKTEVRKRIEVSGHH